MSFKRDFIKNIFSLAVYNYSSQILNFLASIILSRLLLPEEYGYVALITVFTGFIIIFSDAGISYVIIRSDYGRTFQRALSNLAFYIGILLFIVMIALAYPISLFYGDPSLLLPTIVISFSFILTSIYIAPMAIISKELDFNFIGRVKFISNLVSIIFMILLAFLGFSYWALIIPQLLLLIVQYVMFERKVKLGFKFYKLNYLIVVYRKTKSLIFSLSGFNLINYWARNSDNLIIGKVYSSYDLGIYNRAYKMLQMSLSIITGLFGTVLYPSLKKLRSEGKDFRPEYIGILGIISLISFPIGALLILFPKTIVNVLWGENWILVSEFLPYFGLLILFQTLISTTGNIYILLKKETTLFYLGLISSLSIISAIIFGAFYSVVAIAIAYTICNLLIIVPLNIYVGFYKTFNFSVKIILKFWLPKLVLGLFLFFSIFYATSILSMILLILYTLHLIYIEKHQIMQLVNLVAGKLLKTR